MVFVFMYLIGSVGFWTIYIYIYICELINVTWLDTSMKRTLSKLGIVLYILYVQTISIKRHADT